MIRKTGIFKTCSTTLKSWATKYAATATSYSCGCAKIAARDIITIAAYQNSTSILAIILETTNSILVIVLKTRVPEIWFDDYLIILFLRIWNNFLTIIFCVFHGIVLIGIIISRPMVSTMVWIYLISSVIGIRLKRLIIRI